MSDTDTDTYDLGDTVIDADAGANPNTAVVVATPDDPAYKVRIPGLGKSVADANEGYPASGPVATVAFEGDLDRALDVWREASPDALAQICEDNDVKTYTYPCERLRPADEQRGEADE